MHPEVPQVSDPNAVGICVACTLRGMGVRDGAEEQASAELFGLERGCCPVSRQQPFSLFETHDRLDSSSCGAQTPDVNRYEFELNISPEEFLEYYRGTARHVIARSRSGQTVQFPAALLQRFIQPDGIHGAFVLTCDDQHRHPTLEREHQAER